ncbi:hypothetical protein [Sphingomonas sp. MS122]|uniref:hypothetical protein n=1 Tax=Sphingomonas sp. MS122 TaxID=3412683 RepID=UPI003C2E5F18
MTDPIPGKRFGALYAWPDGDAWSYLPAGPSPQRGPDGRAQLTAVEAADMLMLTLGTALTVSEADLAEAQAAIAIAAGAGPEAEPVRLRAANATPRGATLTLTIEGEAPVEVARANPSPLAPYSAAFSAMLRGDRAKQANAALKDGSGKLEVAYDLELAATRSVTARVTGDPDGIDDVEAAIAAGDLTLMFEADPGVSDALKADARKRVVDEVARLLRDLPEPAVTQANPFGDCADAKNPDNEPGATTETRTAAIDAHATRTEPAPLEIRLGANVADWL